ncbi:hypothetical protein GIB67_042662, partial [Kingdonia uniflora]
MNHKSDFPAQFLSTFFQADIDGWIEVSTKNKSTEKELVDLSSCHSYGAYALAITVVQMRSTKLFNEMPVINAVLWTALLLVMFIVGRGAEVDPWSKTKGLGDVLGGLPPAMAANGHWVMTDSPCYNRYKDVWNTTVSVEVALEALRALSLSSNKYFSGPYGDDVIFIGNDWKTTLLPYYIKSINKFQGIYESAK